MGKTAFIFPGQGSQFVGMGKSLHDYSGVAREVYGEASSVLGFDVARLCFEGPREELDRTEFTQPALLTASIAALRVFVERFDVHPDYLAGHSLGEYTALVASGSLAFRDAVALVHLRGKFMQESVPRGTGKMAAILGLDVDTVTHICESATMGAAVAVPANINSPAQVVISGHTAAVEIAEGLAKERGAKRVIPLQVSAPSHSPLMEPAAERLKEVLAKVDFKRLLVPVVTNVEAAPLTEPSRVKGLLAMQLTSPVRWVESVERMKREGVVAVVEIGPGKVLTGLVKRIDKDIECHNVDEAQDLDKLSGVFKERQ